MHWSISKIQVKTADCSMAAVRCFSFFSSISCKDMVHYKVMLVTCLGTVEKRK